MAQVTTPNFLSTLQSFLTHLPRASFLSLDEEMTGIRLPSSKRPNKADLPQERYESLKKVPERYGILQVGIALFFRNPEYDKLRNRPDGTLLERGRGCERGRARGTGGPGLGMPEPQDGQDPEEEERAFLHREGTLNQDELEVWTEREEEEEAAANGGGNAGDGDRDGDGEENEHSFLHREGALNQDELEDWTEREDGSHLDTGGNNGKREVPEYTCRIYNFHLFPSESSQREVTLAPSTIKFLLENKMDFNRVFSEGISYTAIDEAERLKNRFFEKKRSDNETRSGGGARSKERVKLTRAEDVAFVARTMASLREWIDAENGNGEENHAPNGNNDGEGGTDPHTGLGRRAIERATLVFPPCNAFLRRCLYETIEAEYPGLILEKADATSNAGAARNQIRVLRLSPSEKKRRENRLLHEEWSKILHDIGFTTVFQAVSDACNGRKFSKEQTEKFLAGECSHVSLPGRGRKVPVVVHNGLMDLMFLLTHCHSVTLPDSFEDTKKLILKYFPLVYDTKILSTEYSDTDVQGGSTALGELYQSLFSPQSNDLGLKKATILNQNDGESEGQAHEAAWDAYMTGCAFYNLAKRILEPVGKMCNHGERTLSLHQILESDHIENNGCVCRGLLGLNKIYMHFSLYTIDLESSSGPAGLHDPLTHGLSANTTFYVSGINTTVSTRDILRALTKGSQHESELLQHLKYEIIWMDDASFFVGTKLDNVVSVEDSATISLIALHVHNKLHAGLEGVQVLDLSDYFSQKNAGKESMVDWLASTVEKPIQVLRKMFGKQSDEGGRSKKRRRVE